MTMKKAISVLLTALLLLGLSVPAFAASVYESYRIPSGSMRMIAHTGYSAVAPGNTIPAYEAAQIRVFGAMADKGYIYRGAKPVYWSWSSESALAEAEIEYHDIDSTSLYYANKVKDGKGVLDTDTYIVVWTTPPFTVTASRGLTVGPDMDYVVVKPANDDRKFVVAEALLDSLAGKFGWESFKEEYYK